MVVMRSLKNHPWVLVHSLCFLALAIHVMIIGRNLLYPLHPHTYIKEESLQNVAFPVIFKICFKPAFKDDELLSVGYKNSWGYLTGVSLYNKSVVGWAGHRQDGGIVSNVTGIAEILTHIHNHILSQTELRKDYFCPVSGFSTKICPNHVFGNFCQNLRNKSKHWLVFYQFIFIWS